ncbi:MAG: ribosomal protein S21/MRP21 [Sandaracinaceae bacterium]|nr:ribosomal protein S21/MRP21 [Sandaracinaceae bacterium]
MASEGILREPQRRRHYMKPSVKARKRAAEASAVVVSASRWRG